MERKWRGVEILGIESDVEPIALPEPD